MDEGFDRRKQHQECHHIHIHDEPDHGLLPFGQARARKPLSLERDHAVNFGSPFATRAAMSLAADWRDGVG